MAESENIDRVIQLVRSVPVKTVVNGRDAFRMMIQARYADEMPNEIFIHQRSLVDIRNPASYTDEFCAVCSPFDITLYPANVPDPVASPAFFRKSVIDVYLPSLAMGIDFWNTIYLEVQNLLTAYAKLDVLKVDLEVWVPAPPSQSEQSELSSGLDSF